MISPYLIAPICAWIVAQGVKYVLYWISRSKRGKIRTIAVHHYLYRSGGMPSAHTSVAVSLSVVIGSTEGFNSAIFGLALIFTLIVIYDAMNVRYSVGEQAKIIGKILQENKRLTSKIHAPAVIRGHTVTEVIGGFIIGMSVGYLVLFLKHL